MFHSNRDYSNKIKKAFLFALEKHKNQKYGKDPFIKHLYDVVENLFYFNFHKNLLGVDLICSGWLHDTIEDTETNYGEIRDNFGLKIAEIVYSVTDELGRNRQERSDKSCSKLLGFDSGLAVKLADLLANVQQSKSTSDGFLHLYREEYPNFRTRYFKNEYEFNQEGFKKIWETLDKLLLIPEKFRL